MTTLSDCPRNPAYPSSTHLRPVTPRHQPAPGAHCPTGPSPFTGQGPRTDKEQPVTVKPRSSILSTGRSLAVSAVVLAAVVLVTGAPARAATAPPLVTDPASLVNTLVATTGGGNVFPGPDVPFGMVQWSPDTRRRTDGGGYRFDQTQLRGFSLTHISGPGCGAYEDVPILPLTGGLPAGDPGSFMESFTHAGEVATAGYYSVKVGSPAITTELTSTLRSAMGRFTYPATTDANVLLKLLDSQNGTAASDAKIVGKDEVQGMARSGGFCGAPDMYNLFFDIAFDHPFTASKIIREAGQPGPNSVFLTFDTTAGQVLQAKVGISFVSAANAKLNRETDNPGWDFDAVRSAAHDTWNALLSRIQIGGGTTDQQALFYTMLYRVLLHPNVWSDANGEYSGFDQKTHTVKAPQKAQYANFSGWDTYHSQVQLAALLAPGVQRPGAVAAQRRRRVRQWRDPAVGVCQQRQLRHGRRPRHGPSGRLLRLRGARLRHRHRAQGHDEGGHHRQQRAARGGAGNAVRLSARRRPVRLLQFLRLGRHAAGGQRGGLRPGAVRQRPGGRRRRRHAGEAGAELAERLQPEQQPDAAQAAERRIRERHRPDQLAGHGRGHRRAVPLGRALQPCEPDRGPGREPGGEPAAGQLLHDPRRLQPHRRLPGQRVRARRADDVRLHPPALEDAGGRQPDAQRQLQAHSDGAPEQRRPRRPLLDVRLVVAGDVPGGPGERGAGDQRPGVPGGGRPPGRRQGDHHKRHGSLADEPVHPVAQLQRAPLQPAVVRPLAHRRRGHARLHDGLEPQHLLGRGPAGHAALVRDRARRRHRLPLPGKPGGGSLVVDQGGRRSVPVTVTGGSTEGRETVTFHLTSSTGVKVGDVVLGLAVAKPGELWPYYNN